MKKIVVTILLILAQSGLILAQNKSKSNLTPTAENAPLEAILKEIKNQLQDVSNQNKTGYTLTSAELTLIATKAKGAEGSIGLFDVVDLGGSISKEETQTLKFSFEKLPLKNDSSMALLSQKKELADRILDGIKNYKAILDKKIFPGLETGSFTFTIEFTIKKEATGGANLWVIKIGGKKGWTNGHSLSLTFKKE